MPDVSELDELLGFPVRIREFVNSVRERNPESCWPFGSICDHTDLNDQVGQLSLSVQNAPENTEAHESFEGERRNGNQVDSENENSADDEKQNLLILSLHEQNVPEDTSAPETAGVENQPNGKEIVVYQNPADSDSSRTISDLPSESRNIYRRQFKENVNKAVKSKNNPEEKTKSFKNEKFRRLSDINAELKDEKLEIPFPNYLVDDITRTLSRKRKAEKANLKKNKKKNMKHKANESPRFDKAEPSKRRVVGSTEPCGPGLVVGRVRKGKPSNLRQVNRKKFSKPSGSRSVVGRGRWFWSVVGRVHKAKPTNQRSCGPSGSRLVVGRAKKAKPLKRGPKRLKSDDEINDPRLKEAAFGLLCLGQEVKCVGLGECDGCEPTGSQSVVVVRADEVNGSIPETEMAQENELETEDLVCTVNQNPADFSTEIAKKFMRM